MIDENGDEVKIPGTDHAVTIQLPVGAFVVVRDGQDIGMGEVLARIPTESQKTRDITGGLPRVAELFEARSPKDAGMLAEVTGTVTFGKETKGKQRLIITDQEGNSHETLISKDKTVLVHDGQVVQKGEEVVDGPVDPHDILRLLGIEELARYIVDEVQDVYRLQGVKINDKHFEIIVHQMMRKVLIQDSGDTRFLENQIVDKSEFMEENDEMFGKKVVMEPGDSDRVKAGQIISARTLRDINSQLKRRDLRVVEARDAVPATSAQVLQGITRAALQTSSFISAASFQETTKVLNEAAIYGKVDPLEGLKENVICGHLIPVGTGMKELRGLVVGSKEEMEKMQGNK